MEQVTELDFDGGNNVCCELFLDEMCKRAAGPRSSDDDLLNQVRRWASAALVL